MILVMTLTPRFPLMKTIRLTLFPAVLLACLALTQLCVAADAPIRLGFGLCGMRERIEALHGQLVLGPSSDASGWTIEASVPSGRGTGQGAA